MSQPAFKFSSLDKKLLARQKAAGFLDYKDLMLQNVAKEVDVKKIASTMLQIRIQDMLTASRGERADNQEKLGKGKGLVGLAAPQVGIPFRMITVDVDIGRRRKTLGRLQGFINPKIVWRSRETAESIEGCFSTARVWGLVRRPIAIKVEAYTFEGKKISRVYEGYTARIFQHEIDHLNGIRFPERIRSNNKRHWVNQEDMAEYKKSPTSWQHAITLKQWQSLVSNSIE